VPVPDKGNRQKFNQCSLFSAFLSKPTVWNNLILLLALVGYGINRQNAFIFLHGLATESHCRIVIILKYLRANFTAACRSLSPQNVMTRKSWDRHPVVNKSDIYSWSPCKGKEFHSIYFSIMTMRQCDSVGREQRALVKFLPISFVRNWHKSSLGKLVSMVRYKS
jgi:hypothetical protein